MINYFEIYFFKKSVNYVYQMFSDIAILVHRQGEDLDSIEANINQAKDYIEKGEKELIKAKKNHQKSRKVIYHYLKYIIF